MSTGTTQKSSPVGRAGDGSSLRESAVRMILTHRLVLLIVLLVLWLAAMLIFEAAGMVRGSYNSDYIVAQFMAMVPLAMLALAEMIVLLTGRGGIDLSVGGMVSLSGMFFGFAFGLWGWPLLPAIAATVIIGGLLGAVNGFLVAAGRFPALIATLATMYVYTSLALFITSGEPISNETIRTTYSLARAVEIPVIGHLFPDVPLGVFTFLLPTVILVWIVAARTTFGRRLYATGTNDVAAHFAGTDIRKTRFFAFVMSGLISGLAAVYIVAQFSSARANAGTSGNGLALPAITIAVLGGVAITGGIGRVSGVIVAALLINLIDSGILLLISGNAAGQYRLFALGLLLVGAALLNGYSNRRYGQKE